MTGHVYGEFSRLEFVLCLKVGRNARVESLAVTIII